MDKLLKLALTFVNWFNGKKTAIGTILLILAIHADPNVKLDTVLFGVRDLSWILEQLGQLIGGVGLVHKGAKIVVEKKEEPKSDVE